MQRYKTIAVDLECYEALKDLAVPLEPLCSVIRRLTGLPPIEDQRKHNKGRPARKKEVKK